MNNLILSYLRKTAIPALALYMVLTGAFPFPARASQSTCAAVFESSPNSAPSAAASVFHRISSRAWLPRQTILQVLPHIIQSQQILKNRLRLRQNKEAVNLPPFVVSDGWPNNYLINDPTDVNPYGTIKILEWDYRTEFIFIGDVIFQMNWSGKGHEEDQILNRAYVVRGSSEVWEMNFTEFMLKEMPNDYIDIVRSMSSEEYKLWQSRDLEKLKRGAVTVGRSGWSYFTLGTDSAWLLGREKALFRIPKAIALRWARDKQLFIAGMSGTHAPEDRGWKRLPVEVSVHQNVWDELANLYLNPLE